MQDQSHGRWISGVVGVLFGILGGCCIDAPPLRSQTIDFHNDPVGQTPAGFTTALTGGGGPVKWVVREDTTAASGKVLVQESTDDTSYRFPLCVRDDVEAANVRVQVQFKALDGSVDQAGGVIVRYSPENYYIARANALEDNIDLFKTINGKREKIQEIDVKVSPKQWHTLSLSVKDSHLVVVFDGKTVIEANDASLKNAGKVGLWTKADSVSAFADLKVEPK